MIFMTLNKSLLQKEGTMLPMTEGDFFEWENGVSSGKFAENKPLLADVQVVQFRRDSVNAIY